MTLLMAEKEVPNNWITNSYGSKQGLLKLLAYESSRLFRRYNLPEQKPMRLVFVCAGNICRSPLAEAVAIKLGFEATSFGLDTRGGDRADPRAIKFAKNSGYTLENHRSRTVKDYIKIEGDLLIGMEPKHILMAKSYGLTTPMSLLGLADTKPRAYIHDPFNTNDVFFNKCEQLVVEKTRSLVRYVSQ